MTPAKYECLLKNIASSFAKFKISLMEKWKNKALVAPTPGYFVNRASDTYSLLF